MTNNSYRQSDDHIKKFLETSSQNYRWYNDHFSVFLLNSTNNQTITFLFFCPALSMIRGSQSGYFAKHYRWSEDHKSVFTYDLTIITDDPTTITYRRSDDHHNDWFTNDPTIIKYFSQPKYYRWSDDQKRWFYLYSSDHRSKGSTI